MKIDFFVLLDWCQDDHFGFSNAWLKKQCRCRVVAEALCLGVPVVMNRHILGGWKYINQQTGEFFSDASDVTAAYQTLRSRPEQLAPRDWYK